MHFTIKVSEDRKVSTSIKVRGYFQSNRFGSATGVSLSLIPKYTTSARDVNIR